MKRVIQIFMAPVQFVSESIIKIFRAFHEFYTKVPEESSLADTIGSAFGDTDSFLEILKGIGEHVQALRSALTRSVIVLALATLLSFAIADKLIALLAIPLGLAEQNQSVNWSDFIDLAKTSLIVGQQGMAKLRVIEPTEAIEVFMRVSLLSGVILSMPWIIMELYLFIAPGLMPRSRMSLLLIIPMASLLFLSGVAFTYFVMLPIAVPFLFMFMGFNAAWRPLSYINLVTNLMLWVGISFQMPMIIYALASVGWVRAGQLAKQWRIAIVLIAILAAIITPTVDPVNMALVMAPMILLYGFSILAAAIAQKR